MRNQFKNKDEDLQNFKTDLLFTDLAEDMLNDLFYKYGREALNWFMSDCDINYGVHEMQSIKNKMEEDFLLDICSENECLIEKTKIYELFPNSQYLIGGMYPENDIIEKLIKHEWIEEFKTWKYPQLSNWRSTDKSFFFKGPNWDKCPRPIREHFEKIKG